MAASNSAMASLPYHEPDIVTILIISSFLLALNVLNHILDRIIYCGLIGQILIGIAWGTPGGQLLGVELEQVIVNLGYLGLILLVYEGGLSTSFKALKSNAYISIGVALTGISLPIAFSFVLLKLADATPLQAFAAGAALCSTSLGTTFTVLGASGLVTTRMGVVLSTAATLDDIVGLVMVQVISNLGSSRSETFSSVTVIRPVLVSLAFAVCVPSLAWLLVKPITRWVNEWRGGHRMTGINQFLESQQFAFTLHTATLLAMIIAASYAGTSNLFAAYLAGALISWWDSEVPHPSLPSTGSASIESNTVTGQIGDHETSTLATSTTSGMYVFETFYRQVLQRILKPFFFASIGFSVPITQMFRASIVWRGIIYTMLMTISKLACGLWLTRMPNVSFGGLKFRAKQDGTLENVEKPESSQKLDQSAVGKSTRPRPEGQSVVISKAMKEEDVKPARDEARSNQSKRLRPCTLTRTTVDRNPVRKSVYQPTPARKPLSLYPPLIVGCAMTARGEIGFLISSLAQSNGVFNSGTNTADGNDNSQSDGFSTIFLVVTWAIMLCTIIGPICVGLLVRRVKKLEKKTPSVNTNTGTTREKDVLGDCGVT